MTTRRLKDDVIMIITPCMKKLTAAYMLHIILFDQFYINLGYVLALTFNTRISLLV